MNDGVRHPTAASPASFILTGVLVWRTRIAPAWAAALTTLGGVQLYGIALVAGVVGLLISTVAYLTAGGGVNRGVLGGTIGIWACFCLVLGCAGLARTFEAAAPRASVVLAVLAVIGLMTGYGYNPEAIHLEHLGTDIWSEPFDNAIGALAFDPWGLFLPLAFLLTAFLVWRTGLYAKWTAAPLLLAGLLFVPSREAGIDALAVAADVLLLAGLAPPGLAMISRSAPGRDRSPVSPVAAD